MVIINISNNEDVELFIKGSDFNCYEFFGSHRYEKNGNVGYRFSVWAPNACEVSLVGDFNNWDFTKNPMEQLNDTGIWVTYNNQIKELDIYKYNIKLNGGSRTLKSDPYGFYSEEAPNTASRVYSLEGYQWNDNDWISEREEKDVYKSPINIYEVHIGSWKRKCNKDVYSYKELADLLVEYVKDMGYTHIEFLPVMEHPYGGSWGYQTAGYYSVISRYGTPKDFMYLVDRCHQQGIGVILDWVPGHFCKDCHGLYRFDGTNLYGRMDHIEWGTMEFDFSKKEVVEFLISNALFWFDKYHIDGLRVDGVSSMLYLDYGYIDRINSPKNQYGDGRNLDAINFMKQLNEVIFSRHPYALMIAEEATAWPSVTRPTYMDGLGYNYKWDMGWMHDTLYYLSLYQYDRKYNHERITFSMTYAFTENFILSISHDEVVHGKKSLINKMNGEYYEKFANLRLFFLYMMTHPGKKLTFMGCEIAQFIEWKDNDELDWFLLDYPKHKQFHQYIKDINHLYLEQNSLWYDDFGWSGFKWIDVNNNDQSVFIYQRMGDSQDEIIIAILNCTNGYYSDYRIGVPNEGRYEILLNSDEQTYGGHGAEIQKELITQRIGWHGREHSITVNLAGLTGLIIKYSPY